MIKNQGLEKLQSSNQDAIIQIKLRVSTDIKEVTTLYHLEANLGEKNHLIYGKIVSWWVG